MAIGKRVHFESVEIREYPIVLGDNPGSRHGPSIELGWEYRHVSNISEIQPCEPGRSALGTSKQESAEQETARKPSIMVYPLTKFSIDDYEAIRPSSDRPIMRKLYILPLKRLSLARQDHTDDEIQEAMKTKQSIIQSRARSKVYRNLIIQLREGNAKANRTRKIKRAVYNLKKQSRKNDENKTNSRGDSIYSGWWLPLSQVLF